MHFWLDRMADYESYQFRDAQKSFILSKIMRVSRLQRSAESWEQPSGLLDLKKSDAGTLAPEMKRLEE